MLIVLVLLLLFLFGIIKRTAEKRVAPSRL
nr:MAG TPA: ATPase [Crassvirales sp.]